MSTLRTCRCMGIRNSRSSMLITITTATCRFTFFADKRCSPASGLAAGSPHRARRFRFLPPAPDSLVRTQRRRLRHRCRAQYTPRAYSARFPSPAARPFLPPVQRPLAILFAYPSRRQRQTREISGLNAVASIAAKTRPKLSCDGIQFASLR